MYWGNDPKHAEQETKEFKKWNILDESVIWPQFNLACVWHAEEQTRGKKVEIWSEDGQSLIREQTRCLLRYTDHRLQK